MATNDETYNGWTNKPTWLVKLWIDNDQGSQEFWLDAARGAEVWPLAEQLQEHFEMACADGIEPSSLASDLMSWAVAHVNFGEIAHALIEDAAEIPA